MEGRAVRTSRIRLLSRSAMKTSPDWSAAIPHGSFNCAEVAGPPSPEKPATPVPAIVEIVPVDEISRTRAITSSTKYTFPELSQAIDWGAMTADCVAGTPSISVAPPPPMVVMVPAGEIFRMR